MPGASWYVYGIAYPSAPSTAVAFIHNGKLAGTNALAGPFATKAEAQAWVNANASDFGPGKTNIAPPNDPSVAPSVSAPHNPLDALGPIGDFFHRLTEGETWVRVGEVALGGIIVYVAFRGLTSGSPTVGSGARAKATSPIKKVAKAGVTVAAPEARLAGRVAAKRYAPKTTERVAKHRTQVAKYGQKKPYRPPEPRPAAPPRVTYRHSTITHVKASP